MKLAEALLLRADLQKKLESLKERIIKNTLYQEGEKPSEDPNELIKQANSIGQRLTKLIYLINEANINAKSSNNKNLTSLLAERDGIIIKLNILHATTAAAVKPPERYGTKEIRWIKAVDVPKLQKEIDMLSKQLRELNAEIQSTNWLIEVSDV
jgi:hypothetical protein